MHKAGEWLYLGFVGVSPTPGLDSLDKDRSNHNYSENKADHNIMWSAFFSWSNFVSILDSNVTVQVTTMNRSHQ